MTATAARPAAIQHRTSNLSVVLTLGRFEGRQMIRHPLFWLGVFAAAGLSIFELIEESPVLNRVSMTLAWTMAPIAVAVALLAGWAVLRARGRSDAHPPVVMPAPMSLRVSGVLIGLTWAAMATFVVQLALLAWTLFRDPVSAVVWTELLVGPAFVAFSGALSAAATRWFPHPSTPLVSLLLLAGAQVAVPYNPGNWGSQIGPAALAPIAWPETIIPYEVAFRPSGLHLAYVVGLIFVMAGVATLGRTMTGSVVLGVGLLAAGVLGPAQLGPISEGQREATMSRLVGDEADLTCETHDGVTFCAMPGYDGWIDDWSRAVAPMLNSVPSDVAASLQVRQYPVHNTSLFDGQSFDNWWWFSPSYEDYVSRDVVPVGSVLADYTISYGLVGGAARELVGCEFVCEEPSRRVISLWLMAHDSQVRENVEFNLGETDSVSVADCMVAGLWDRPNGGELIRSNWVALTAADTSYERAGEILGVEVPAGYDENGYLEGGCP